MTMFLYYEWYNTVNMCRLGRAGSILPSKTISQNLEHEEWLGCHCGISKYIFMPVHCYNEIVKIIYYEVLQVVLR
jgi:hypothetical protein